MSSKSSILSFLILMTTITPLLCRNPPTVLQQTNRLGNKSNGFTAELIHRDNPQSPFYNPSLSKSDRMTASLQSSQSRSLYLSNRSRYHNDALQADVNFENDLYVMHFAIGTPPVETYAIADTGSDIFWLQCEPCEKCFKQKDSIKIFDPAQSSTYKKISCNDPRCDLLAEGDKCHTATDTCLYKISYYDGSYSRGELSLETLTFKDISVTDVAFGCGLENVDTGAHTTKPPGLIGLSREPLSFVIQQNIHSFSYCLVENYQDYNSIIHFQRDDVEQFVGQSTPMLDINSAYYFLSLEGISVGPIRLRLPEGFFSRTSSGHGGFIIDSGTTYTNLKADALVKLNGEMKRQIILRPVKTATDEGPLCYATRFEVIKRVAPVLTFHFSGGLDLVLHKEGTWVERADNLFCIAIAKSVDEMSTLGNFQQINFKVGYDLINKRVSFEKMASCRGI